MSYSKGDLVRVTGTFTNAAGTAIDPTVVGFKYKPETIGTITALVYGTDAAVVKSAAGIYYVDVSISYTGVYHFRFYATGTGQCAGDAQIKVEETVF